MLKQWDDGKAILIRQYFKHSEILLPPLQHMELQLSYCKRELGHFGRYNVELYGRGLIPGRGTGHRGEFSFTLTFSLYVTYYLITQYPF
jgi:hypothetical protein